MNKISLVILAVLSFIGVSAQTFTTGNYTVDNLDYSTLAVSGVGTITSSNKLARICVDLSSVDNLNGIRIRLTSPSGTYITLIDDEAASLTGTDLTSVCFSDDGTSMISSGSSPYTGTWNQEGNIISDGSTIGGMLGGESPNGNWTIAYSNSNSSSSSTNTLSVTLEFVSCQQVIGAATVSKAYTDTLKLCQGETITFDGDATFPQNNTSYTQDANTSTYEWDLMSLGVTDSIYTTKSWNRTFNTPGGYSIRMRAADHVGCDSDNDVTIPIEVTGRPGFAGTSAGIDSVCIGDVNTLNGVTQDYFIQSACIPPLVNLEPLPDRGTNSAAQYETQIPVSCYAPTTVISNASEILGICFNMEHSFVGDLEIRLECPNGQSTEITQFSGVGGGTNLGYAPGDGANDEVGVPLNYCFSSSSSNTFGPEDVMNVPFTQNNGTSVSGTAADLLIPDSYVISGDWNDLVGCPVSGDWTLIIIDELTADDGHIFNWTIDFASSLPYVTSSSNTVAVTNYEWSTTPPQFVDTAVNVIESTDGDKNYTLTVTDEFNCQYNTTVTFHVRPANDPNCAPCTVDNITANVGACNADLSYDITGQVSFSVQPTTGTLTVLNRESGQSQVFNAPFTSPQNYTITGNPGDGGTAYVVAIFSDDATCTDSIQINEADCCTETPDFSGTDLTQCNPANGIITGTGFTTGVVYNITSSGTSDSNFTADGAGEVSIPNLAAGTYNTWVIIDSNRATTCTYNVATSVTLNIPNAPTLTVTGTDPTGCGLADGDVTIGGLVANRSYDIGYNGGNVATITTNASGEITVSGLGVGTYGTWTILDNVTGCTYNDPTSIALNEPGAPTVTVTVDDLDAIICLGDTITISYTGAGDSTFSGPSQVWTADSAFVPDSAGNITYIVDVDNSGCTGSGSVTVLVNDLPTVDAGPNQVVCGGASITLAGSGANSYTWDNGVTDNVSFAATPGLYTVTGTDVNGCVNTDTVRLTSPSGSQVFAGNDTTICAGQSLVISGDSAVSYNWTSPVISNGSTQTPADTTVYYVTGTHADGCTSIDSIVVNVAPLPTIIANGQDTICGGNQTTLWGSGADTYVWNNGVLDSVAFFPGTGNYQVIGTDSNGCVDSTIITVRVENLPGVNGGANLSVCDGDTVTLFGLGASTYVWDKGVIDSVPFVVTQTDTFTVVGTDTNTGCSNDDEVIITLNTAGTVNAGNDTSLCQGDSITFSGSGAVSYLWNNGILNNVEVLATSDTFIVTGTHANNCTSIDTMVVTVGNNSDASFTISPVYCTGSGVLDTITTTNPGGNLSFSPAGLDLDVATGEIDVDNSTIGNYMVYYTIPGNCGDVDSASVSITGIPDATFAYADTNYCESTGLATISFGAGAVLGTLSSSPATGLVWDGNGNIDTDNSTAGVYEVYNTIPAGNGCPLVEDTFQVGVIAKPTISVSIPTAHCETDPMTVTFTTNYANPTFEIFDYNLWGSYVVTGDTLVIDTPATNFWFVSTQNAGCASDTLFEIITVDTVPPTPSIVIADTVICNANSVNFSGIHDPGYLGFFFVQPGYGGTIADTFLMTNNTITDLLSVDTTFINLHIYAGACGLISDTVMIINEGLSAFADAGQDTSYCLEDSVTLHGNYNATGTGQWYSLNNGTMNPVGGQNDSILNVGMVSNPTNDFVWELFIPSCNATLRDTVTISTMQNANDFTFATTDTKADTLEIPVTYEFTTVDQGQSSYNWDLNSNSYGDSLYFSHTFMEGGEQIITLISIDSNGCADTTIKTLFLTEPITLFFPNAFSPDGSSINDRFKGVGTLEETMLESYEITIYDRWGKIVYQSASLTEGWDGKHENGTKAAPHGLYSWVVKFKVIGEDKNRKESGSVLLIRPENALNQ